MIKKYFELKNYLNKQSFSDEKKYRASLYIDYYMSTEDIENGREIVFNKINKLSRKIPNSQIGDVAYLKNKVLPDREI